MNCVDCKNYCGFLRTDIDYVKCNYWDDEIEFRASIEMKVFVCPREKENMFKEEKIDGIMKKAIDFINSLTL